MINCQHCATELSQSDQTGSGFCCRECETAHGLIRGMGLESYYQRRRLDPGVPPLRPDDDAVTNHHEAYVIDEGDGVRSLHLMVEGVRSAACMWLIESVLARRAGVVSAQLNLSARRLVLKWRAAEADADSLAAAVTVLGYRLAPFDPAVLDGADKRHEKELLRALAVAGFAAANVMLLSIAVWAGYEQGMGPATRNFLYWLSALIALPAIAYAGIPFFRSAWTALKTGSLNMDAPIAMAVIMAPGMSLYETITGGEHAYFDSAVTLLFFLLISRYLDCRSRGRACSAAEHLVALNAAAVTVAGPSGKRTLMPPSKVTKGMTVLVCAGERIGVDGTVVGGDSTADVSLISGESLPAVVARGDRVFAGAINLSNPLRIKVEAAGGQTLLAEIVRIMEAAEKHKTRYVVLADRIAAIYGPAVHVAALATFVGWMAVGAGWHQAMMIAMSVVIITCPCALGLAVPAVQVAASGRLFRGGVLIKSATALERLAEVDTIAFDKTGTLTSGRLELMEAQSMDTEDLSLGASLAAASRHPLARALVRAAPTTEAAEGVVEEPGKGLTLGDVRLGSRDWCGVKDGPEDTNAELWLSPPGRKAVRFAFEDRLRTDAGRVVAGLKDHGYRVEVISGDRASVVESTAAGLGIKEWRAALAPGDKCRRLEDLSREGRRVLMVGDGLNDAPALAAAHASLSPSTALDVSQTAADAVFQGERLQPVAETLKVARRAATLVRQNLAFSFVYNAATVPLAVAGLVTPLIAAVAMSASSLVVVVNALRLGKR